MSRNDQAVRQLCLLQRLEAARSGLTLEELAGSLPADAPRHVRTIRRDLEALEAAGFPLVTERVGGRTRWRLMEGFRQVPALRLSPTELMALAVSRRLLAPLDGTQLQAALSSALAKAAAALPPPGLAYARRLEEVFSVGLGPYKPYASHRETVERLTRALDERRTVQMRYFTASRGRTARREVDPYCLYYVGGALYLIAYDHWRRDVRVFAVERIRSLTLTDHAYQMPLGFDPNAFMRSALVAMRGRPVQVELLFSKATAAWVRDRVWHPSQRLVPLKDGRLRMTLEVADTPELVGWILHFGSGVRVVRPESLREKVQAEARRIAQG
ncbi:MAG TPA: transcriptional regulator [Thermodesulfobacteriota bacterium]|nr:transcriptional regulator [Thermodesulfobacteriota bacterium]